MVSGDKRNWKIELGMFLFVLILTTLFLVIYVAVEIYWSQCDHHIKLFYDQADREGCKKGLFSRSCLLGPCRPTFGPNELDSWLPRTLILCWSVKEFYEVCKIIEEMARCRTSLYSALYAPSGAAGKCFFIGDKEFGSKQLVVFLIRVDQSCAQLGNLSPWFIMCQQ